VEQSGSSLTVTENFDVGMELVETQTPPNNILERLPQFQEYPQCPKTKTPGKFPLHI